VQTGAVVILRPIDPLTAQARMVLMRFLTPIGLLAGLLMLPAWLMAGDSDKKPDLAELLVPPGNFVNLETHRLYYRCTGAGSPVVVIDNGIGGAAIEWTTIQDAVAKTTRVCTYDRAGYGWSDTGPGPRTTARSVASPDERRGGKEWR